MSKVILYMAISVNGYIAKKDDDTSWISAKEWNSYSQKVQKSGNLVIGHRTYDICQPRKVSPCKANTINHY